MSKTVNTLNFTRYVPLNGYEEELKRNPSAKVFREIAVTVGLDGVQFTLGTVTREAANGGYHNGALNKVSASISLEAFLGDRGDQMVTQSILGREPFQAVAKILEIRDGMVARKHELLAVLAMMSGV